MNNFNTQDYDFLLRTLSQGSLIFKSESLKRLLTLAINDKKQFVPISKNVLSELQSLYQEDKEDINLNATLILSEIVTFVNTKEHEILILNHHLQPIIKNLGHPTKTALRKASHTFLLAFLRAYNNFNSLVKGYTDYGLNDENSLVQQETINSLQSILILQLRKFDWTSEQSRVFVQTLLIKTLDQNTYVVKAAAQCLISMSKIQQIQVLVKKLSVGYLLKLKDFLTNTIESFNINSLKITPDDIQLLIDSNNKKNRKNEDDEQKTQKSTIKKPEVSVEKETQNFKVNTSLNNTQRRLQKIRNSIKNENKKTSMLQKQSLQAKFFGNIVFQGSIKEKTDAAEQLLYKIQSNIDKPEFQASIKSLLSVLIKMLKDNNPKIVGITLKILESIIEYINPNDKNFGALVNVIVDKLGDVKISIRQSVCKVIKELIRKTKKGMWLHELIENMKKNTNTFLRDETLGLILSIFEETPKQQIDYDFKLLLENIVIYADDPKTKIKIRTLDCLAQIVFVSQEAQSYNQSLKARMTAIFYQMYLDKLDKLQKQRQKNEKLRGSIDKKIRQQFTVTSRTAYDKENPSFLHKRNQSEADQSTKLNVSADIVRKRVSLLKKQRGLMSTQETTSVDNTSQKTIERSLDNTIEDLQVMLPSLYKKTANNRFINKKLQNSVSMNKTIDHKNTSSQYLSKDELTPLKQPEKCFREIMNELKSNDWKVLFQTTNKLRRLIEFDSNVLLNSTQGIIHSLVMQVLSLVENLRSCVSKNALITLNQLITVLSKRVDPEVDPIFDKVIKKSADTNIFISAQVQKVMQALAIEATSYKIIDKINQYKNTKSIPIKETCLNCLLKMQDQQKIREKQYIKLTEIFAQFLFDGSQEIRVKAKTGITAICDDLGDWYRALRGRINPSYFKSICEIMSKNTQKKQTVERYNTVKNSPKKSSLAVREDFVTIKSQHISLAESPVKKEKSEVPRKKLIKISNFPSQFDSLQGYFQQCNSSDWKRRISSLNQVKEIALQFQNEFMQYRSANHFIDTICKQMIEPNIKVSINAMIVLQQVIEPLRGLVQNNLSIICNSVFNCLSSNKPQIKQKSEQLTWMLLEGVEIQSILQYLSHGILYSLPKSRVYLLDKLKDKIEQIHEKKKQLLFKYVFPLMNKLMEEYKAEMVSSLIAFFNRLFDVMGNQMYSHLTKFKEVKELINR